jgi:EAL domain-containing protein (putative c-di-GMP-specific phosphodiesterase class I)
VGAEALLRWIHPQRGVVLPIEFIHLAEETGLILPIGLWALDTACAQLKEWGKDPLTQGLTLSVNISAKQFNQATFVNQVQTALQRYAINPSLLKLELTESIMMEHIDQNIITLDELKALGVHFVLGDFGTGYASLQYLKKIPLSQLKINPSFVRDIVTDSNDRAILHTMILMVNSLGLQVMAEGVETEQQRQILLDNGCKCYQGYLFGRPMSIDNFESKLRDV